LVNTEIGGLSQPGIVKAATRALDGIVSSAPTIDQSLVVRHLSVATSGIRSHVQLSGSCVFHSTLWALAICLAIRNGSVAVTAAAIDVHPINLLATVTKIDLAVKRAAVRALASASGGSALARLAEIRYARCAWWSEPDATAAAAAALLEPCARTVTFGLVFRHWRNTRIDDAIAAESFRNWKEAATWVRTMTRMVLGLFLAHDSYVSFFCGENTERVTLDLLTVLLYEFGQCRQARIFPGEDLYYPNEKLVYVFTGVPVV
jgi:hypothetical protein